MMNNEASARMWSTRPRPTRQGQVVALVLSAPVDSEERSAETTITFSGAVEVWQARGVNRGTMF